MSYTNNCGYSAGPCQYGSRNDLGVSALETVVGNSSTNYAMTNANTGCSSQANTDVSARVEYCATVSGSPTTIYTESPFVSTLCSASTKTSGVDSYYSNNSHTNYSNDKGRRGRKGEKEKIEGNYLINPVQSFRPGNFVSPVSKTKRIVATKEVQDLVGQTFETLTKKKMPNFHIEVCGEKRFYKVLEEFGGIFNPGTVGFAINKLQSIFVLENNLAELLLTIGHEIGHLMTKALLNPIDEEAKAMAFAFAWARAIKEHNIGGLEKDIILPEPARNGLHDRASMFVNDLMRTGNIELEVFEQLSRGYVSSGF